MTVIQKIRPTILYVDQEIHNLISFSAIFRRDYEIIRAGSVTEALIILEKELIEIIICSKDLAEMSGIDFLQLTMAIRPNCTRLLVSDYINLDVENKARIFDYLIKPWDEIIVRQILEEAFEIFKVKEMRAGNCW